MTSVIVYSGQMILSQTQPSAHDLKPEVTRDCSSVDFSKVRVMQHTLGIKLDS